MPSHSKRAQASDSPRIGRPPRLSREHVVAVAVKLVTRKGLSEVTMRALADELDATPMALYRHVGDRDALALLVVDDIMARVELPAAKLEPIAWLRALARSVREIGLAHPGVMDVLLDEGPAVKSALVILDRVVRKLHDAGLGWAAATAIHNTFLSWLAAAIRREERWAAQSTEGRATMKRFLEAAAQMPGEDYPGVAQALAHMPGANVEQAFETSLDFMLEAIAVAVAKAASSTKAPKAARR